MSLLMMLFYPRTDPGLYPLVTWSTVLDDVYDDFVWVFFGLLLICTSLVAWSVASDEVSASNDFPLPT